MKRKERENSAGSHHLWFVIRSVIGSRWRQQQITTWTTRRVTRGLGGREIREEITRFCDRWSVTEWPPTDQFQDKYPGENARSNRAPISHRVHGHRGFVLHAIKLGLRFPARALRMDLAWSYLRERRAPRRYNRAREWPEGVSKPVSDWWLPQPITCMTSWRGNRICREQCLVSVPSPATPGVLLRMCDSPDGRNALCYSARE